MISILLPSYNEAENLKAILPRLHETLGGIEHEILVIDTVEPMDDTEKVCLGCKHWHRIYRQI